jgi:holo-[acyl-carrier protein] synthase
VNPSPGPTLGVGTDLVEVERLRAALDRRPGLRTRLFTAAEWDYATRHRDPMIHLAARFAAKESVMKALGRGMDTMSFAEIEVVHDPHGAPTVRLHGRAAAVAADVGVADWLLSLTHTATLAQAVALARATAVPATAVPAGTGGATLGA